MPRHQYSPVDVVCIVLADSRLFSICELVFSSQEIVHASYVARKLGMNVGYAYKLLRKLEKWNVVKGVKDPINGKLAFRPTGSKAAQLLAEELRKREASKIEKVLVEAGVPW